MILFFLQNPKDFFSNDTEKKRRKKSSYNFLLNLNSGLKPLCTLLMLKRKIPFLPHQKCRFNQNLTPLVLAARGTARAVICVFARFLPLGLPYSLAPHPTGGGAPGAAPSAACWLRRLGGSRPPPRAASRTRALPPSPARAAPPAAAAATG